MIEQPPRDTNQPVGGQLWPQPMQGWTMLNWPVANRPVSTGPVSTGPVRIGDAERDRAIATLSDHFAAGRLSREELDERIDKAMTARFDVDLEPLFADLPRATEDVRPMPTGLRASRPVWPAAFWLVPMVLVAAVTVAIILGAPWMIWAFVWVFMFSGFWRRRRFQGTGSPYGYRHHHTHNPW